MRQLIVVPALAILGLSAAPIIPNQPLQVIVQEPVQVMASRPMPQQASETALIASERIEPTHTPNPQPIVRSAPPSGSIASMMRSKAAARFGAGHVDAMMTLVGHESGMNPYAINPTSGACGIPQALPCSKLLNVIGSLDNVEGQLDWMIDYVARRFNTPSQALTFWRCIGYCTDNYGTHHKKTNWY